MLKKKIVHYIFLNIKKNLIYKNSITILIMYLKNTYLLLNTNFFFKPNMSYEEIYDLKFKIKTKYLFMFTIYIIYSKLAKITNVYNFKFNLIIKKQDKFTILRAPCNHKNSKEQFTINKYSGRLTGSFIYLLNKFYHSFIMSFFLSNENQGLSTLKHNIQKKCNVI